MKKQISHILIFSIVSIFYSCNRNNHISLNYNSNDQKICFNVGDNIKQWDLAMNVYWKDSLLFTPYIEFGEKKGDYMINSFPTSIQKPYLLDICYQLSKDKKISLQYKLKYKKSKTLIDTTLSITNIINSEISKRKEELSEIPFSEIDLNNTGFSYFNYFDSYGYTKATLYAKGIRNIDEKEIKETAYNLDLLLNNGYKVYSISQNAPASKRNTTHLYVKNVPKNIPKVYLLLASLSGKDNGKDFSFDTEQEIADFVSKEYVYDFKQAINNNQERLRVPIYYIGNHKYNFVQVLFLVYILANNDYKYIPVGYKIALSPQEIANLFNENTTPKLIISPIKRYYIGNFLILYFGQADVSN